MNPAEITSEIASEIKENEKKIIENEKKLKYMVSYTKNEEIAHAVSHGLAAVAALVACILLTSEAVRNGKDSLSVAAIVFFCVSFIFLYLISFLYHTVQSPNVKQTLRIFDHCMIYILITASYAPACLCMIKGFWGILVFIINLICMIFGIIINIIDLKKYYRLSQALYIIMGWMIVLIFVPAIRAIPVRGFVLLAIGGVCYTVGAVFYRMKSVKYMHFVFHLLVIAGCIPHFLFVWQYCCH